MLALALPIVERWHDFYVMAGGAAAALLGLLFTTMALRSGQAGLSDIAVEQDLWAAASVPFACFLDILLVSLAFLVPDQSTLGLGLPVLGLAVLGLGLLRWVVSRQWSFPTLHWRGRLLTVVACYLAQIAVAALVLGGHTELLWLLAVVVGGLNLNAALASWELLRQPIIAQVMRASATQGSAAAHSDTPESGAS